MSLSSHRFSRTLKNPPGEVIWAANLDVRLDLSAYAAIIQKSPDRLTIVNDPTGLTRKVLKMTALNDDVYPYTPTENPRCQVETPAFFVEGADYWVGQSLYIPGVAEFPIPTLANPWISIGSVYGPPFAGTGPNGLSLVAVSSSNATLQWQMNASYNWKLAWEQQIVRGAWVDIVRHINMSTDPSVGFVEQWTNTGMGWSRNMLNGEAKTFYKTMDATNNSGPNRHALNLYYQKDAMPGATIYTASHSIGTSFAAVAPTSYGWAPAQAP